MGRRSFECFAIEHMDFMYKQAIKLTTDMERAEDLVQRTIDLAFQKFDQYHTEQNFQNWLHNIMRDVHSN
jgi:DNA-directed RNA polymerase specialized sigma24 family protein